MKSPVALTHAHLIRTRRRHLHRRRRVFGRDPRARIMWRNRKALFRQQTHMLRNAPPGIIWTVFDRVSISAKVFDIGRVKRKEIGYLGCLNYQ